VNGNARNRPLLEVHDSTSQNRMPYKFYGDVLKLLPFAELDLAAL
jgi:hypothetical protein